MKQITYVVDDRDWPKQPCKDRIKPQECCYCLEDIALGMEEGYKNQPATPLVKRCCKCASKRYGARLPYHGMDTIRAEGDTLTDILESF